ncbi:MAG: trehalose-6-phosphate synthase [Acidobacteria bacterium]|nr:trehalose-6-phosphate synthase [Acidobacteriota bacterium]
MKRIAALALAVAGILWVQRLAEPGGLPRSGTALALGFTLLGASIAGALLRRIHLPRLTGYLVFGLLSGPYLGNVITAPMASQLQVISGVATTFIALIAGLTLNLERLGRRLHDIVRLTGIILAVAMAGAGAVAWVVWPWLPIAPDAAGLPKLAMVLLTIIIVISFSPTMTAAVTTETGARGRLSETVLAVVVLADLAALVVFSLSMQFARGAMGAEAGGADVLTRFAWEIGGAVAFGVLVGALVGLYLKYVGRETTLIILAACALLSQVGSTQQFEPLLAAVAAGLVIENLSSASGDALKSAVQRAAPPVLVIFFVAVGASLRIDAPAVIGLAAVAVSVVRLLLIRAGVAAGARRVVLDDDSRRYMWTGLVSQAGITLGFAAVVAREFGGWGMNLQALVVALIGIHELAGPLLFRRALLRAGERGAQQRRPLVVLSNREPYMHSALPDGTLRASPSTGGVAVALDALMRERGGVWIAHGAGPADRLVVDAHDTVMVPPDSPSYALRRLWFDEPTFAAYYKGFANEGLWPLCHVVDVRPQFRADDWAAYQEINDRFAEAAAKELRSADTPVFIQDYHLALVASALRRRRPNVRTALFWHIPWPSPDRLRICPWSRELLAGLLANDLLAFQLERDRRNFLQAAREELGAAIEPESSEVQFAGHDTTVVSVPIGVDYDRIQDITSAEALALEQARLTSLLDLRAPLIGIGVDRLDYTKGIPERLAALDLVVSRRPALRGQLTFIQIGVPSRSEVSSYAALEAEIDSQIEALNRRHAVPGGAPLICYYKTPLTIGSLVALYRMARFCIVSSLHDGMNLVAKEFVAAREDEDGVLVLSALAGAAQELRDALIINPYDVEGFAAALLAAIDMPPAERRARMRAMRRVVAGRNVFGWASDILEGLESLWSKPLHYSVRRWEEMAV